MSVPAERCGSPPRLAVITCAVLEMEIRELGRGMDHVVHVECMEQGLHNDPARLRAEVQAAVARLEATTDAEAILLGYGLCSRGTEGVVAGRCLLVIPRAHDCITVLLGCRQRYADYVARHPGTYWYSPGWNKHHVPPGPERHRLLYQQYREKYGEDNAEFLMETEQHWFSTYDRAAYVDLGIGESAEQVAFTRRCAEWLGWKFDRQHGDPELLRAMLQGCWDEDRFLVLQPGQTLRMTGDERIIEAAPAADRSC